jgi:hypothetical protein
MSQLGANQANVGPSNEAVYSKGAIPFIWGNSGTVAANGALTLGTALPQAYPDAFMLFPAGAVFAGSPAGAYYVKFSTTLLGQIFNNVYIPGIPPAIPAVLNPVAAAGPGAYTGVTGLTNGPNIVLPANTIGPTGFMWLESLWSIFNSAGAKTPTISLGGQTLMAINQTTNQSLLTPVSLWARGAQGKNQVSFATSNAAGSGAAAGIVNQSTVDLTAQQTLQLACNVAVATDYCVLEAYTMELFN